ncbi:chromosome segregation protein SMC, partial [Aduncisulcus paluster]
AAEGASREAVRAARRETDAARERHAATEREINRHAARKSALTEAHSRVAADRAEAEAAHESAAAALAELPPGVETEAQLAAVRAEIDNQRRAAAQAIVAERNEWQTRKTSAASQVETVEARIAEVSAEREELANAPEVFAEKRSALITEIEHAEGDRRIAADALATAEAAMAETDRVAKATLEALSSSREATARAEERMEGTRRRLADIEREIHDMLEVEPSAVVGMAE